jgi:hypothetical protein
MALAKAKIPSVRAIDELKARYNRECGRIDSNKLEQIDAKISISGRVAGKEHYKEIIAAIEALDLPFDLVSRDACNIIKSYGDRNLAFELKFNPHKVKSLKTTIAMRDTIIKKREHAKEKLDAWYENALYHAANREKIDEFKI